jgi:hypothetical protein
MWYRSAQDKKPIEFIPEESEKSDLDTLKATPQEIETAKKIIELRNNDLPANLDDASIAKIIEQSKPAHVEMKKLATALNDIANFIPFENLKPTFRQYANSLNGAAEQYLTSITAAEFGEQQTKEKAKKTLDLFDTLTLQNVPNNVESIIKFYRNNQQNMPYFINLIGDFIPGSSTAPGQLILSKFKIADYQQTWLPFFIEHKNLFIAAKNKYNAAKDIEEKQQAEEDMKKHFAMLLGFLSNACVDLSTFTLAFVALAGPAAPIVASVAGVFRALSIGLQSISWLMDPEGPVSGIFNVLEGLPYSPDKEEEKSLKPFTKITDEEEHNRVKAEMFSNPYLPIAKRLNEIYNEVSDKDWESKYGQKKTETMYVQPLNTLMKFAYDNFGEKYFWMNQPASPKYRNFGRLLSQAKSYVMADPDVKKAAPSPSKRSIGHQLVDSALNNQMTYQNSKSLIREMANKYTAGNIYNFLNKKNVEINNLIEAEARNTNFAARYNLRPGSALWDNLKTDIMNLKKILNTWK